VERREALGPLLLIVVLGEGIAIYGLLIALLVILLA
jgi:F0F1-type ATP synthase membrane subunit c/vacuolar-type H+-ATPase subunit K